MNKHSDFPASGAHRWARCAKSWYVERQLPDSSGIPARLGTLAHDIADRCCEQDENAATYKGEVYYYNEIEKKHEISTALDDRLIAEADKFEQGDNDLYIVDQEMVDGVQVYLNYVRNEARGGASYSEVSVEYNHLVPEGFTGYGTSDNAIVYIEDGTLVIVDLKYGKGVQVHAFENYQLLLYGIGALKAFDVFGPFKEVILVIVQPRLDHIDEWVTTPEVMTKWAKFFKKQAHATQDPNAQLTPSAEACQFCRARDADPPCQGPIDMALKIAEEDFMEFPFKEDAATLARVIAAYPTLAFIEATCRKLRDYVLSKAIQGEYVEGYKVVNGRKGRKWEDETPHKLYQRMVDAGVENPEDVMYKAAELRSPPQVESVIGKSHPFMKSNAIEHSTGALTLVPIADKRRAVDLNIPEEDFKEE